MGDKVTLYYLNFSMPCRACFLLLRHLNVDVEIKIVEILKKEQFQPEFLKLNPVHKIPVLVDGDFVLSESRAILAYLVNTRKPGSSLYPSDPKKRAIVDQRLYYDATVIFAHFPALLRPVIYGTGKEVPAGEKEKVSTTFGVLEGFLEGSKYFAGDELTIADLSILPSITTFVEFGFDIKPFPKVSAWYEKMKAVPGFDENIAGAKGLNKHVQSILGKSVF